MEDLAPFSSVWGLVTHVSQDPQHRSHVLITIAGQVLRFERSSNEAGLQALGVLSKLTGRGKSVFLIFYVDESKGSHTLMACWKNPRNILVRKLQPAVLESYKSVKEHVAQFAGQKMSPSWKRWSKEKAT